MSDKIKKFSTAIRLGAAQHPQITGKHSEEMMKEGLLGLVLLARAYMRWEPSLTNQRKIA